MTSLSSNLDVMSILDFWLLPSAHPEYGKKRAIWFASAPEFDVEIARRFGPLLTPAAQDQLDDWMNSAHGILALILLCDQFPRNVYRKTAQAFAADKKALHLARVALERNYPSLFPPAVRTFFYLPFCHSEHLDDQELACHLVEAIDNGEGLKIIREHRDVIAKFGRFPHRNEVLGRPSTTEEIEHLRNGPRWGQ